MTEKKSFEVKVTLLEGVEVHVQNNHVTIKGPRGEVSRTFVSPRLVLTKEDSLLNIKTKESLRAIKYDKTLGHTFRAHLRNMMYGVLKGYEAKLKICSGHFPMTVSTDTEKVTIKNFLGEKVPRHSSMMKGVEVKVNGNEVIVTGIEKEAVGQTAARIEQSCRITNRDRRIFQDGIWIIQKPQVKE